MSRCLICFADGMADVEDEGYQATSLSTLSDDDEGGIRSNSNTTSDQQGGKGFWDQLVVRKVGACGHTYCDECLVETQWSSELKRLLAGGDSRDGTARCPQCYVRINHTVVRAWGARRRAQHEAEESRRVQWEPHRDGAAKLSLTESQDHLLLSSKVKDSAEEEKNLDRLLAQSEEDAKRWGFLIGRKMQGRFPVASECIGANPTDSSDGSPATASPPTTVTSTQQQQQSSSNVKLKYSSALSDAMNNICNRANDASTQSRSTTVPKQQATTATGGATTPPPPPHVMSGRKIKIGSSTNGDTSTVKYCMIDDEGRPIPGSTSTSRFVRRRRPINSTKGGASDGRNADGSCYLLTEKIDVPRSDPGSDSPVWFIYYFLNETKIGNVIREQYAWRGGWLVQTALIIHMLICIFFPMSAGNGTVSVTTGLWYLVPGSLREKLTFWTSFVLLSMMVLMVDTCWVTQDHSASSNALLHSYPPAAMRAEGRGGWFSGWGGEYTGEDEVGSVLWRSMRGSREEDTKKIVSANRRAAAAANHNIRVTPSSGATLGTPGGGLVNSGLSHIHRSLKEGVSIVRRAAAATGVGGMVTTKPRNPHFPPKSSGYGGVLARCAGDAEEE